MSKKLIAVASAAALAVSLLVAAPASATAPTVIFTTHDGGGTATTVGTASAPSRQNVPDMNTLDGLESATIAFSNIAAGDVLTINASGKVRIVTAKTVGSADVNVTTLGTQAFSRTFTTAPGSGNFSVFASVTDTVASTINWSVVRTGSTTSGTLHIQGRAGQAYALTDVVVPATLAAGASTEVRFRISDVFGNQLETPSIASAVTGAANTVAAVWDSANRWHDATITSSTNRAFIVTVDGDNAVDPADVAGFAAATTQSLVVVNGGSAAPAQQTTQIATLTAQIAALTTQLANSRAKDASVTKKRFNTLARKWNAANPTDRVKLKR